MSFCAGILTTNMAPTLGYWDVRGLAGSIRMLLYYTETEYTENMYSVGPGPDFDQCDWTNVKATLGLPFPNLPYYIDGDVKLSQSNAILRHIGRKHKMNGMSDDEKDQVDMLLDEALDWRFKLAMLCTNPAYSTMRESYVANMDVKLKQVEDSGRQRLVCGKQTDHC